MALPRILVAAPASGSGKTVFTCALTRLLMRRGLRVAAFKCGPDYIDQLFHRSVTGAAAGNLDTFFADREMLVRLMARGAAGADIAVAEGTMGYYDGMAPGVVRGSSYDVALATQMPVVLVVPARGASTSLAALVQGFMNFQEPSMVAAVVLNGCSRGAWLAAASVIEERCGVPVVGYVPHDEVFSLKSRHLGLVCADEVEDLSRRLDAMADALEQTIDIDRLLTVAREAPLVDGDAFRVDEAFAPFVRPSDGGGRARLAIARDDAFCFYYAENLRMLEDLGVELVPFSPLADETLPAHVDGVYLGGGYPELHARELSHNPSMRSSIKRALAGGCPCVAECGGFLYLGDLLKDPEGVPWPMVGALPGVAERGSGLGHFGYINLELRTDGLMGPVGEVIRGHEFHYWRSTSEGEACWAQKPARPTGWPCMVHTPTLAAGFPHVYYSSNPKVPARFVDAMRRYREKGCCGSNR